MESFSSGCDLMCYLYSQIKATATVSSRPFIHVSISHQSLEPKKIA